MISITVKGKNFDTRAKYWWPAMWYYENSEARWIKPTIAPSAPIPITQTTVTFANVPINAGFASGFYTTQSIEDIISGELLFGATDIFVLNDGATYILDFHNTVGIPTVSEEEIPEFVEFLDRLRPWMPWAGPPLPKGFFPPWPWWNEELGRIEWGSGQI